MPVFARIFFINATGHVPFCSGRSCAGFEVFRTFWGFRVYGCVRLFVSWLLGYRFGEALHPGPLAASSVTFAVVNPTTILDKEWQIQQVGADVLLASETSANQRVQKIMTFRFRGLGYRCMWGAPTADRYHKDSGQPMLRSFAQGVAAFSSVPCRPPLHPLPDELFASCRITECFVRVQTLDIKVIVIYGVPRCLPDAAAQNNRLLSWAYQRATVSCVPAIIGGDFNDLPQSLPAWESFACRGWVELGEFASAAHGLELPCTCKGATRFDTFLLPPVLLQFFHGADVLQDAHLFDSHSPMRLHLRLPGAQVPRWIWPLPKDFTDILAGSAGLDSNYQRQALAVRAAFAPDVPEHQDGNKVRLWAATVEEAVHATIRDQHRASGQKQLFSGLPRSFRGRCRDVERKRACPPRLSRAGRQGDPEPFDEDTTVLGRQRLRQLRRLTTFQQGFHKHFAGLFRGAYAPDGWPVSLHREWRAIVRASGYGVSFADWVLQWPCFPVWPQGFPSEEFLACLVDFIRFDVQALQRQNAKVKSQLFRFGLRTDETDFGCAKAFARVRPPSKPPFQCVQVVSLQAASTVEILNHQLRRLRVPDPSKFDLLSQVTFMSVSGQITHKRDDVLTVLFPQDDDAVLPLDGHLQRSRQDCTWRGLVGSLTDYWHPIWTRDSREEEADIANWPQFQSMLHRLLSPCSSIDVDMLDSTAWLHVARRLSPHKARGICGWSNAELRVLPASALRDLALGLPPSWASLSAIRPPPQPRRSSQQG